MKTIQIVYVGQESGKNVQFFNNQLDVTIVLKQDAEGVIEYANANLVDIVLVEDSDQDNMVKLQKILPVLQEDILVISAKNTNYLQNAILQKRALLQAAQKTNYSVADDALKQAMLPIQIQ